MSDITLLSWKDVLARAVEFQVAVTKRVQQGPPPDPIEDATDGMLADLVTTFQIIREIQIAVRHLADCAPFGLGDERDGHLERARSYLEQAAGTVWLELSEQEVFETMKKLQGE